MSTSMSDVEAIATPTPEENGAEDFVPATEQVIQDKILHVLNIWPILSPSMLQIGLGTALPPKLWHPVLARLVEEKKVIRREISVRGPSNRDQSHTQIYLANREDPLSAALTAPEM